VWYLTGNDAGPPLTSMHFRLDKSGGFSRLMAKASFFDALVIFRFASHKSMSLFGVEAKKVESGRLLVLQLTLKVIEYVLKIIMF